MLVLFACYLDLFIILESNILYGGLLKQIGFVTQVLYAMTQIEASNHIPKPDSYESLCFRNLPESHKHSDNI